MRAGPDYRVGPTVSPSPILSRRSARRASQRNHATLAARTAAPSPMTLKRTLTAMKAGTASRVGSHRSRHSGSRLKREREQRRREEEERRRDARLDAVAGRPATSSLSQPVSIPWQSSRRNPSRKRPIPTPDQGERRRGARASRIRGRARGPARRRRSGCRSGSPRSGCRARAGSPSGAPRSLTSSSAGLKGSRLHEVPDHEARDEGRRGQQPADRCGAERHPASLSDPGSPEGVHRDRRGGDEDERVEDAGPVRVGPERDREEGRDCDPERDRQAGEPPAVRGLHGREW